MNYEVSFKGLKIYAIEYLRCFNFSKTESSEGKPKFFVCDIHNRPFNSISAVF